MDEKELLNIVEHSLRLYKDEDLGNRFGLMEYYSLTDLSPIELSKIARKNKKISLCNSLTKFNEDNYWLRQPVKMNEKFTHFHSINGHELTEDEKLTIYEKMQQENYPLLEGIYCYAARVYVNKGVDAISKEQVREKVKNFYNVTRGLKTPREVESKLLVK